MVNRSLLRIKALQVLYSSGINNNDINSTKIEIQHSIKQAYNLYHYLLLLISDTTNFVELEDDKFKNRIQQEESFDHTRFMKNRFACQMVQNVDLYSYIKDNQLDQYFWDKKFINKLFYTTITSPFYEEYLSNNDSYENDKWIWRKIFEKILVDDEIIRDELNQILEDKNIFWINDFEIINSFVVKTIKQFKEENSSKQELLPLYNDESDYKFISSIIDYSFNNQAKIDDLYSRYLVNWDSDRISLIDKIILRLSISELLSNPTIPISVTINEYIEITKLFSSPKNSRFINGILDNIISHLKETNQLNKIN